MKFRAVLVTSALSLCAFSALAEEAPSAAPGNLSAAAAAPSTMELAAPAPSAPTTVIPTAALPGAPPELIAPLPGPTPSLALAADGNPLAGWHNGVFYLRDRTDNYRLYLQGRAQIDFYGFAGPGVPDTTLKPTLFLRRIRPEIGGEFFKSWWFSIAGDFGATNYDNPRGTNETSAANPAVSPTDATGRYATAQTPRVSAAPTDVFLNYRAAPFLNFQIGQFDAPFTMENRTSDKYLPFMERSLAVRAVGIPTNKEIGLMLWGELTDKYWFYSAGLFDGDGQNRLNTDGRGDFMARTFVHPLASDKSELKDLQIGASLRYGSRNNKFTYYDYPGLSTQGGYTFWNPTYGGSEGTTHVLPSGTQLGVAGELRIPVSIIDLTSEVVYIKNNTREVQEGFQASPGSNLRLGDLHGVSYYVEAGIWLGKRDISGLPGYENMTHVDFSKPDAAPTQAVELLAKWEQIHLKYGSASRGGSPDAKNMDGDIKVNAVSFGLNYWATKHIRLSANYVVNLFPDSAPISASAVGTPLQSSSNRALAPGNTLAKGVHDDARDTAHSLQEFLLRAAVAL
jgi:phosphate-selective porin